MSAKPVVAVGFFDGIHLGHRGILAGADVALTFRNHPISVLSPGNEPRLLMSVDERLSALRASGVREVRVLDFTPALADLSPDAFAATHLSEFGAVRCGANWRFGAKGAGDAAFLRTLGKQVTVVPYALYADGIVSSTRIRAAVRAGDVAGAAAMLARPWSFEGRVRRGKGLGTELGFPTVNLEPVDAERLVLPCRGVYAVRCAGRPAVANWGVAPTMGERAWTAPVLEVHFLGPVDPSACSRPDASVRVDFHARLRDERTFPTPHALAEQIAADCADATRLLAE